MVLVCKYDVVDSHTRHVESQDVGVVCLMGPAVGVVVNSTLPTAASLIGADGEKMDV